MAKKSLELCRAEEALYEAAARFGMLTSSHASKKAIELTRAELHKTARAYARLAELADK
jgi:hypothetical protein